MLLLLLSFHAHCISSFQRDSALWRRSANVSAWSSSNGSGGGEWKEAFNWLSSSARRLKEEKGSAAAEQNGFYIITLNDSRLFPLIFFFFFFLNDSGNGVHREILDHFAPWIAWCYRRAPLIPCSSRDFLIYYTHTHPMTLFVADHRPIISSEQGALLLCLMCVRCTLRRPHLASMQRRPFYISIIYCSPSTTFCCNTARTWDDDEYQPDTAAAAAGAFLSFFSFHPPFFFFLKSCLRLRSIRLCNYSMDRFNTNICYK